MTEDQDDMLRYDRMVEGALRNVVKKAINEVMEHGLPGDHHFYITFMTDFPGVEIPDYLRERYPGEMTIVLQYQFYDLKIENEILHVTLSFNNVPEQLRVPMQSISIFADPSVNFALQFQPFGEELDESDFDLDDDGPDDDGNGGGSKGDQSPGEVVSLDKFRKK